jgi:hypothetical protein
VLVGSIFTCRKHQTWKQRIVRGKIL